MLHLKQHLKKRKRKNKIFSRDWEFGAAFERRFLFYAIGNGLLESGPNVRCITIAELGSLDH